MDHDIKHSIKSLDDAEKKLGNWTLPPKEDAKVQIQGDNVKPSAKKVEKKSDPICPSSGCPEPKNKPAYPVDYPVPNLGMDHDIKASMKNLDNAEEKLGPWKLPPKNETTAKLFPTNNTLSSKPAAKSALAVSADVHQKDDPICSSAGCTQYKHPETESWPKDYPVANFGVDHEIVASETHTAQVE